MSYKNTRKKAKNKIVAETFFVFFIAISPILYKLYDFLPEDPEATISFLGMTIDNNGFPDISTYAWFMMSKLIPLYLLIFWFMTSKNWWYHIILIPIAMYSFQVFEVIFDSDNNIDTENIWWLLPICMVIIPFVYLIRIKLFDKHVNGIDLEAMQEEINVLKAKKLKDKEVRELRADLPKIEYRTLSEWLNQELSTANIERVFRRFQTGLKDLLAYLF